MKLGVIGTSIITEQLLQTGFKGFSHHSVLSRSVENAKYFQDKYNIKNHYSTLEEMIASDVEAVYIASPNALHYPQALALMSAKKHVLVEKPFVSTVKECQHLVQVARENSVVLLEAIKTTLLPNFHLLVDKVRYLKNINNVEMGFCKISDRYTEFLEGKHSNIFSAEMSGGSLVDIGVYGVWFTVQLFGVPKKWTHKDVGMLSSGVDHKGTIILEYDDFDVTIYHSKSDNRGSWVKIDSEQNIEITGFSTIQGFKIDDKPISSEQEHPSMYYELAEFYHLIQTNQLESAYTTWDRMTLVMQILEDCRKQSNIIFKADHL